MTGMLRIYGLAILLPILAACATDANTPSTSASLIPQGDASEPRSVRDSNSFTLIDEGITVERDGDTAIYRGRLTEDGLAAMRTAAHASPLKTLLIESTGGEIVVGMEFGDWVLEHKLDVVVDRACLSSCANYVFTAGRNKEIRPGAVVAWHGSAKQPGLLEMLHKAVEAEINAKGLSGSKRSRALARARRANVDYLTSAIYRQNAFFYRVGVDEYVTRIGNDKFGINGFFYLSVVDMASFGIENVTAPEQYAEMEPRALAKRVGFPVSLVRLY